MRYGSLERRDELSADAPTALAAINVDAAQPEQMVRHPCDAANTNKLAITIADHEKALTGSIKPRVTGQELVDQTAKEPKSLLLRLFKEIVEVVG